MRILIVVVVLVGTLLAFIGCHSVQRKLLYYPSHQPPLGSLSAWHVEGELAGYKREVDRPKTIWLFIHGNAGQAEDRTYALPYFSADDSVFILEYPGYGHRPGAPSRASFNAAALAAYEDLRRQFPGLPVCIAGESIGSGPACALASARVPPDKLVLVVPFDRLSLVAREHFPFLPVGLLLRDNWNNIESLSEYQGAVEIFGAKQDEVIPVARAQALAASHPRATYHEIDGGHNTWSTGQEVRFVYP